MNYRPRECIVCKNLTEVKSSRPAICSNDCREIRVRQFAKDYHIQHQTKRNIASTRKRKENKQRAVDYLGGKCLDCGQKYSLAVYDFHHLDPTQKDIQVSWLMNWNWGVQQKELDKCVLLCSNCHRLRHHGDF